MVWRVGCAYNDLLLVLTFIKLAQGTVLLQQQPGFENETFGSIIEGFLHSPWKQYDFALSLVDPHPWAIQHHHHLSGGDIDCVMTQISLCYSTLIKSVTGCVTCHTCHGCVTDFRPILGNPMEVTHVTSPGHV